MKATIATMSEEQWQAIIRNDKSYDNQFLYAVKTTGIFCRPSCKSREPIRQNVRIFQNGEQALSAEYRPCKRCKPTGQSLPDEEWVTQITQYIDMNYTETITLKSLAYMFHGSPYHLHRTFKKTTGVTTVHYIQQIRMSKAKEYLVGTDKTISDIAQSVGMYNTPYFITLFKKKTGYTPTDFRQLYGLKSNMEVLPHDV